MTLDGVRAAWLAWLAALSGVTAATYAYDKWAAQRGRRRIRERSLWCLCLAGGVAGAWLAFFGLHHKTRHRSFWVVQSIASALQVAILGVLFLA